jgi:LAO/AO transport system kinase
MHRELTIDELLQRLIAGDRVALGKAITLVESSKEEHQEKASQLLAKCTERDSKSWRIGITGVPGVGKSTFIEALGLQLIANGAKVAVLAVDPSSDLTKGSILGDKTRMDRLSADANAFIRPSPSGGTLGGVARRTRETIMLCEAAGYDNILIETVGVGQSETLVHSLVDMFVLLVLANAGDELQGIKRGIMEMADLVVINKDDGANSAYTKMAVAGYAQALHLFPAKESGWSVPVLTCSSTELRGFDAILASMERYFSMMESTGRLQLERAQQSRFWLQRAIDEELRVRFLNDSNVQQRLKELEEKVASGKMGPFEAARELLRNWSYNN